MAITGGFGMKIDLQTGTVKPWSFRAAKGDDGKTWWLADQRCPICGAPCSTNDRVTQCLGERCSWDDAGSIRKENR